MDKVDKSKGKKQKHSGSKKPSGSKKHSGSKKPSRKLTDNPRCGYAKIKSDCKSGASFFPYNSTWPTNLAVDYAKILPQPDPAGIWACSDWDEKNYPTDDSGNRYYGNAKIWAGDGGWTGPPPCSNAIGVKWTEDNVWCCNNRVKSDGTCLDMDTSTGHVDCEAYPHISK